MFSILKPVLIVPLSLAVLAGCSPGESSGSTAGKHTVTQVAALDSLEECPNGGVTLEHGIDQNGNGVLDSSEVANSYALCHGRDGDGAGLEEAETRLADAEEKLASLQESYDALKSEHDALIVRADGMEETLGAQSAAIEAKVDSADLAAVALSGSFMDLTDSPDTSSFVSQTDFDALSDEVATKATSADLEGLVTLTTLESTVANFVAVSSLSTLAFTGAYADVIGAPDVSTYAVASDLSEVAYTGDYSDLDDRPDLTIFASQNELSDVALSGDYGDLSNTPEPYELPADLSALNAYLSVNSTTNVIQLSGANLFLNDGSGQTACLDESALPSMDGCNGLGNLVVGYGENNFAFDRGGSHNIAVGLDNGWTGFGGLVVGRANNQSSAYGVVLAGRGNNVAGDGAAVVGGEDNYSMGLNAVALGGFENTASGELSAVLGGRLNKGLAERSVIAGGAGGEAHGASSVILGGTSNKAFGSFSLVAGGDANETFATGINQAIIGGQFGKAHGHFSLVLGSFNRSAFGAHEVSVGPLN